MIAKIKSVEYCEQQAMTLTFTDEGPLKFSVGFGPVKWARIIHILSDPDRAKTVADFVSEHL